MILRDTPARLPDLYLFVSLFEEGGRFNEFFLLDFQGVNGRTEIAETMHKAG